MIQNLAQKMKQHQTLFSPWHCFHHQRRSRSFAFTFSLPLPVLLPFGLKKSYDTRKLESHDGASYVAVGRFDNDVQELLSKERAQWLLGGRRNVRSVTIGGPCGEA